MLLIFSGAFLVVGLVNIEGGYEKGHEIPALSYGCSEEGAKKGRCIYITNTATLIVCCTAVIMGLICMVQRVDTTSRRKNINIKDKYKTKMMTQSEAQNDGFINLDTQTSIKTQTFSERI